ncbi:hypothetical protein QAD02_024273 [Eretmocerus hayati]|uniref:Uncharacterized protein n=1 Tax=Eretmocerus hayati TaxID=131215 RepID=A0ACC2PYB0_9HYME|nr:hypothetical protein QAD02_024273 [Eretmocerus hayati]
MLYIQEVPLVRGPMNVLQLVASGSANPGAATQPVLIMSSWERHSRGSDPDDAPLCYGAANSGELADVLIERAPASTAEQPYWHLSNAQLLSCSWIQLAGFIDRPAVIERSDSTGINQAAPDQASAECKFLPLVSQGSKIAVSRDELATCDFAELA